MLIPGIWSNATPRSKDALVDQVTDLYGNTTDAELEAKALQFLDDAVDDMNTHLWEFNKMVETGIAMTAEQSFVPLSAPVYREVGAFLVDTSSGEAAPHLTFLPWIEFRRLYGAPNETGQPLVYSYFNPHREGKLHLAPTPDTSTAANSTLTFEFYRRTPRVSEEDPLQVPREIEQLLIYGAQKRMAIHLLGASNPDVVSLQALETKALDDLRGVDKRSPDERLRFRLVDHVQNNRMLPHNYLVLKL